MEDPAIAIEEPAARVERQADQANYQNLSEQPLLQQYPLPRMGAGDYADIIEVVFEVI